MPTCFTKAFILSPGLMCDADTAVLTTLCLLLSHIVLRGRCSFASRSEKGILENITSKLEDRGHFHRRNFRSLKEDVTLPEGEMWKCLEEQVNGSVRQGTVTNSQIPTLPNLSLRTKMLLSRLPLMLLFSHFFLPRVCFHLENSKSDSGKISRLLYCQSKKSYYQGFFYQKYKSADLCIYYKKKKKSFPSFNRRKNLVPGTKGAAHSPCP